MLVPTMTPEEIYADMCKDAAWLNDQITYKIYPSVQSFRLFMDVHYKVK